MDFGILNILNIFGSLAMFMYGMKIMSDGIQKAAGATFRNTLRNMTRNRWYGLVSGIFTTAALQSSSATTVMTVSFVNAGLLSVVESAGLMMGANIGTTITGWLVAILGYKISLHEFSLPLLFISVPLLFAKNERLKYWGEFLIGFAIIFLGLNFLSDSIPDIQTKISAFEWVKSFTNAGIFTNLLFVLLGAIITIVLQSSSAAMILTMTMSLKGWIPFEIAAALILGENIGTTITAEIAAIVANRDAKRAARVHSLFNIIGVLWMLLLLPLFINAISWLAVNLFNQSNPKLDPEAIPIGLSIFHTTFNVINALVLIGFIPYIIWLTKRMIPTKVEADQEKSKNNSIVISNTSPELATVELKKVTAKFAEMISRMSDFTKSYLNATEMEEREALFTKIIKYEGITDNMRDEITEYITKLSKSEMTSRTSIRLRSMLNICNEMERIGDIFQDIGESINRKNQNNAWFNPTQRNTLNKLLGMVDYGIKENLSNLRLDKYQDIDPTTIKDLNTTIKSYNEDLKRDYFNISNQKDINLNSIVIYNTIISSLYTIQKHINDITDEVTKID